MFSRYNLPKNVEKCYRTNVIDNKRKIQPVDCKFSLKQIQQLEETVNCNSQKKYSLHGRILPKYVEKNYRSVTKSIMEKLNLKPQINLKFNKNPASAISLTSEKKTNVTDKRKIQPVECKFRLKQIQQLVETANCNSQKKYSLHSRILLPAAAASIGIGNKYLFGNKPIPEPPTIPIQKTFESVTTIDKQTSESLRLGGLDQVGIVDKNSIGNEPIPEPPKIPIKEEETFESITTFGEQTSESLRLGALDQVGIVDKNPIGNETIPEPPTIPIQEEEILESVKTAGKQTFESLGLGGWGPFGIIPNCLEFLHFSVGIPLRVVIFTGTISCKILMYPALIIVQRNGAKMKNYLQQLEALKLKMTEARKTGNKQAAARYEQEMVALVKQMNLNPIKNIRMPLFKSSFNGLRDRRNSTTK